MSTAPAVRAATEYSIQDFRVHVVRVGREVVADVYGQSPFGGEEHIATHRGEAVLSLVTQTAERIEP